MNVSTVLNIPVQISLISSLGSYLEMFLGEKVRTILRANVQLVKDTLQRGYVSFHPPPPPPPKRNVLGMQVSLRGGGAKAQSPGELPSKRFLEQ